MTTIKTALIIGALTLGACQSLPEMVPVTATPSDRAALEGEWEGQYDSGDLYGRSGTLRFDLQEGRDTATGYILMTVSIPSNQGRVHPGMRAAPPAPSLPIAITFVRAHDGIVIGELARYNDPDCGCRLQSTFSGRVKGNYVSGTFVTRHIDTGAVVRGVWSAHKQP